MPRLATHSLTGAPLAQDLAVTSVPCCNQTAAFPISVSLGPKHLSPERREREVTPYEGEHQDQGQHEQDGGPRPSWLSMQGPPASAPGIDDCGSSLKKPTRGPNSHNYRPSLFAAFHL